MVSVKREVEVKWRACGVCAAVGTRHTCTVNGRRRKHAHSYTTAREPPPQRRGRRWPRAGSRAQAALRHTHREPSAPGVRMHKCSWRGRGPRVRNSWTHNSFRIDCYGCPSRVSSCAPAIYLTSILSPKAECASTSVVAAHAGKTRSPSPPALVCLALPPHLSARTAACDVRVAILLDFV